jgi:hypothetical protein
MKKNNHPLLKGGPDMAIIFEVRGREILDSRGNSKMALLRMTGRDGKR